MSTLRSVLAEGAGLARVAVSNAPGLLRTGVLTPVGPVRLARMASALLQWRASLAALCAVAAVRWPDQPAVIDERGTLRYAELEERATALAGALAAEFGIEPGQAVAVMCRNHRGFIEAVVAASKLGADVLLLNTEFPAATLTKTLQRYPIGAVICDEEFSPRFEAAGHQGPLVLAWREESGGRSIDDLAERGLESPRSKTPGKLIILTSGTTGVPKGVPRTPSALATLEPGITALTTLSLRAREPMLIAPPLFHGFGLAFLASALTLGDTVVLRRKFDPEQVLADIHEHRVGAVLMVPVMLQRVLGLPAEVRARHDVSSIRVLCSGASALTPTLAERVTSVFGPVLYNGYGSSEVGIGTLATPADLHAAPGTVGKPIGGVRVRVVDPEGNEVPAGATGRIFVGSGMTFEGYSGGGGRELIDGLASTGDLGHLDTEGRL